MARLLWDPQSCPDLTWGCCGWSVLYCSDVLVARTPVEASGELRLDLGGNRLRYLFVVIELHGEGGAPLRHGAQIAHVAEHVGERHHRVDDVGVAAHVLALDLPAA